MIFSFEIKGISQQTVESLIKRAWANKCSVEKRGNCLQVMGKSPGILKGITEGLPPEAKISKIREIARRSCI